MWKMWKRYGKDVKGYEKILKKIWKENKSKTNKQELFKRLQTNIERHEKTKVTTNWVGYFHGTSIGLCHWRTAGRLPGAVQIRLCPSRGKLFILVPSRDLRPKISELGKRKSSTQNIPWGPEIYDRSQEGPSDLHQTLRLRTSEAVEGNPKRLVSKCTRDDRMTQKLQLKSWKCDKSI